MIDIWIVLYLIFAHTVFDFFAQSRWMVTNKSSSLWPLFLHICVYSIPFFVIGFWYAVVNALAHMATDFITSRIAGSFYKNGNTYGFFCTIGVDQAVHMATLIVTYPLFIG